MCPSNMKWTQASGRISGNREEIKILNGNLDVIQCDIHEAQRSFAISKIPFNASQIKAQLYSGMDNNSYSLVKVFKQHNEQFKKLVGMEYAYGTYKKFKSVLKSLQSFLKWKINKTDVYLTDVNHKFITDYEFYLKTVQKLKHNSAMVNIKKLKKVIRICVANDWLNKDPFKGYKIITKETHRNFLLQHEIEILLKKQISIPRLNGIQSDQNTTYN